MQFVADRQERLDRFLTDRLGQSRNQIEQLIKKGFVRVDEQVIKKGGYKLKSGQKVDVELPEPEVSEPVSVDFDIPRVYEDEDILVLNKPPGVVIHPAPSVREATLVDWLKKEGVSLSTISGEERHGIVHRLDKETSGLLVVAKNDEAHRALAKQLQDRSMGRYYLALITPPLKEDIIVERPIARHPKNRLKMGIVEGGRHAKTHFVKLVQAKSRPIELIAAKLYTGRTHQIRVHLSALHRHILGDYLYGFKDQKEKNSIDRIFLHAYMLYLVHPRTQERLNFIAPLPDDMGTYMQNLFDMERVYAEIDPDRFTKRFVAL